MWQRIKKHITRSWDDEPTWSGSKARMFPPIMYEILAYIIIAGILYQVITYLLK
jgi:hypothetical protein